jgi:integrase
VTSPEDDVAARLHRARVEGFLVAGSRDTEPTSREPSDDPLAALIDRTAAIYRNAIREDTRAAYARRWGKFERWCEAHGFTAMPTEPETVMLFLAGMIEDDDSTSLNTLRGYTAAIGRVHREAGQPAPNDSPLLSQFMRGLSRHTEIQPPRPVQTGALRISEVRRIMRYLDTLTVDARALRDAAILSLHHLGLGDGQIERLTWTDLRFDDDAPASVRVGAVRAGAKDRTLQLSLTNDGERTAVERLLAWRALIGDDDAAPVFVAVDFGGATAGTALSHRAVFKARQSRLASLSPEEGPPVDVPAAIEILSGAPSEVLRDRALLLLGFAMAGRRGEVVGLRWSDLVDRGGGLVVHIRSSKTDLSGRGVDLGVPAGQSALTDPVAAVKAWRERVATQLGSEAAEGESWVFPHVGRAGRITTNRLSPEGLTVMVRRRAKQAGVAERMGGRSLRAGFITTAAELDIPLDRIAKQSRHKTMDSLALYVRTADPTIRSAAGEVGL